MQLSSARMLFIDMYSQALRTFRERLLSGFGWSLLSAVALQGSVLLSSIVVARLLSLSEFGAFAVLTATVMTIAAAAQVGTGIVAVKFVGENLADNPVRVARVLRLCRLLTSTTGAFSAALVFAFAKDLSTDLLGRPELESLVRMAAAAVYFQVSVAYQFGALQGFGAFKELSRGGVLVGLSHIALTALGAWTWRIEGALIGFVLASALRTLVFSILLRRVRKSYGVAKQAALDKSDLRMAWRFALPAALAGLVTMPCPWLVTVLVTRLDGGLGLVGIFTVAHQIRLVVLQLPSLLNAVSFSVLSRLKGSNEADGFRRVFWSNLWFNLAFSALFVLVLLFFSEPVLRLYGPNFADGRLVLTVLLASVLPELLATSIYQLVQTAGRMWHSLFLIALPRDLLYLGLAALWLPTYGVIAAAWAYLVAQGVGLASTALTAHFFARETSWARTGH